MELVILGRGKGKTTQLIKMCHEHDYLMVVHSHNEAQRVATMARDLGLDIRYPLYIGSFINGVFSKDGVKGFVIDNAEVFLRYFARGVPVKAIAIGKEELDEPSQAIYESGGEEGGS